VRKPLPLITQLKFSENPGAGKGCVNIFKQNRSLQVMFSKSLQRTLNEEFEKLKR